MMSCFFSSNFLISSENPSCILLIWTSMRRSSSSLTWVVTTVFSLTRRDVFSIILRRSTAFYLTELAISSTGSNECPLCSSYMHFTHTEFEQFLQKYSTNLFECLVQGMESKLPIKRGTASSDVMNFISFWFLLHSPRSFSRTSSSQTGQVTSEVLPLYELLPLLDFLPYAFFNSIMSLTQKLQTVHPQCLKTMGTLLAISYAN